MSNWNERKRNILTLKLGGEEKRYDPWKCMLNYQRAVRDMGGVSVFKTMWDRVHEKADEAVDSSEEETSKRTLLRAEAEAYLSEIGARIYGEKPYDPESNPGGFTTEEGAQAMYSFFRWMEKKDSGAENSPTPVTSVSTTPGETNTGELPTESDSP